MNNDLKVAHPYGGSLSTWFLVELEFAKKVVFKEWGKPEYPEKNIYGKGENQQQTQPTYGVNARIRTQTTLVRGECSHRCATLALIAKL